MKISSITVSLLALTLLLGAAAAKKKLVLELTEGWHPVGYCEGVQNIDFSTTTEECNHTLEFAPVGSTVSCYDVEHMGDEGPYTTRECTGTLDDFSLTPDDRELEVVFRPPAGKVFRATNLVGQPQVGFSFKMGSLEQRDYLCESSIDCNDGQHKGICPTGSTHDWDATLAFAADDGMCQKMEVWEGEFFGSPSYGNSFTLKLGDEIGLGNDTYVEGSCSQLDFLFTVNQPDPEAGAITEADATTEGGPPQPYFFTTLNATVPLEKRDDAFYATTKWYFHYPGTVTGKDTGYFGLGAQPNTFEIVVVDAPQPEVEEPCLLETPWSGAVSVSPFVPFLLASVSALLVGRV